MRSASPGNGLHDRARPPRRKQHARGSAGGKIPALLAARGGRMPKEKKLQPQQHQRRQPGREYKMKPRPQAEDEKHRGSGKLQDKVAIITGGDSGIGRAVAIAFAKEGAHISVVYLEEQKDANETRCLVEEHGSECLLIKGDVGQEEFCRKAVAQTVKEFGKLDILLNNAAEQHPQDSIERITEKQLERTFGSDAALGRAGQPEGISPRYVFLASADSSYMTGQILHPNGGTIVNG